ncbi:MFS transporter [Streptomyces sp. SID10853]|uniref:Cmx/CmrA family chloramphenicol efflux MFS transporter n=1 Tax=Streptomyces sp. SID10853 TaxID=2706028 RepID=UPI0013BF5D51|nr:Cmx/CmrA family chloramphenicol efflux MFS transporter [Streptomyces sp. SID10853]NDZ77623.1 MFS transporter [Streptomyces sp. SID10853]
MPFAVYVLGLAVFAQGTSEFMLSGLISGIATDLNVSLAAAGLLASAFAVGMVIGAPLMALFSRTWPRRRALLLFLSVFVAVHVLGALTPSYGVLLATRFAGAVANAGFWAVALTTAAALVPEQLRARATAVVVGGVTVACVVGVPAGAVLGERWGWRSAFWAVALVSVPAVLAVVRSVPGGRPDAEPVPVRTELRALTRPRLRRTLLTMALVQGATFCTFAYLEPLLRSETGLSAGWVPAALALFGVGSFLGVTVAGRLRAHSEEADSRPTAFIACGMAALALGWSALALTAGSAPVVLALLLVQGAFAFGTGTALLARVLGLAPGAPTLAGAFSTTAFNLGATLGPWAGGLALDAGFGYRAPVWVSGALMGCALVTAGAARWVGLGGKKSMH